MNKYNQLREEIIKANKDIVELKRNCYIKVENFGICIALEKPFRDYGVDCIRALVLENKEIKEFVVDRCCRSIDGSNKLIYRETEILKIIGRDITPIDILKTRKDLAIDGLGGIFIRNHCNKKGDLWEMEYCGHYDIDKPLQDQSDECKELLWELICKE